MIQLQNDIVVELNLNTVLAMELSPSDLSMHSIHTLQIRIFASFPNV